MKTTTRKSRDPEWSAILSNILRGVPLGSPAPKTTVEVLREAIYMAARSATISDPYLAEYWYGRFDGAMLAYETLTGKKLSLYLGDFVVEEVPA